jgi:pseudaminic acid synthase
MSKTIEIQGRSIGEPHPVYVIAELSANHNGDIERAKAIVRAAAAAGADAIKLQTYTAETLTLDSDLPHFRISHGTAWDNQRLFDLYQEAHTPWAWHETLQQIATEVGLDFFSTPFDESAVDFLETLAVPLYKIASFEIVDIPLVRKIASTRKPVIMSTGMSTTEEIDLAVRTLRENGCSQIALLKCTSAYPAAPESMNLRTIADLSDRFDVPAGLSDHTLGTTAATVAVAMGASVIEKHLTLSRADGGPDSHFSLEPGEFSTMVRSVREASAALGSVHYGTTEHDVKNRSFRPSLFAVRDIGVGEVFTADNIKSLRPGNGLPPVHFDDLMNRAAAESIPRGTPIAWKHIA